MITRRQWAATAAASAGLGFSQRAEAQGGELRVVINIGAGGANDQIGRLVSERLAARLGLRLVVENIAGQGGNSGALNVLGAPPDGRTLLFTAANAITANAFLYGAIMPFDPLRDFAPIGRAGLGTILLVVPADRPWRDFAALVAHARANPGLLTAGSSGVGTISHLYIEELNRAAEMRIRHQAYPGGAPAIADLLAGRIDMMFDVIPAILPHVQAGRLRALAVGSEYRAVWTPALMETPAMGELLPGKGLDATNWWAFVARAGTPPEALTALNTALGSVLEEEALRSRLQALTVLPAADPSPADFRRFWEAQMPLWRALVERSGARVE